MSWDDPQVRPKLLRGTLPGGERLLVLDEIHKYPRWRNLVKGLYDTEGDRIAFLVTGSARLHRSSRRARHAPHLHGF